MAAIDLEGVCRHDGDEQILDDVSFSVADGEFVTLVGPSGSGKTSILRAIAGLDPVSAGTVRFDGEDMTEVPTQDRDIGMISQHNSLFPHYQVSDNLSFPLLQRLFTKSEARKRVEAESRAHNIEHILDRWPESLSGGEQQLAQIARALVRVPRVFLMDEPLAKLDMQIRTRLRREITELQKGYGVTAVYASNRPEEIITMPDRIVALDHGRVVQMGSPSQVRTRPATMSIAQLTGALGQLSVTVEAAEQGWWLVGDGVRVRAWAPALADGVGQALTLGVRLGDVRVAADGGGDIEVVAGKVTWLESASVRLLNCGAGELYHLGHELTEGQGYRVLLDRWVLFNQHGQQIAVS